MTDALLPMISCERGAADSCAIIIKLNYISVFFLSFFPPHHKHAWMNAGL